MHSLTYRILMTVQFPSISSSNNQLWVASFSVITVLQHWLTCLCYMMHKYNKVLQKASSTLCPLRDAIYCALIYTMRNNKGDKRKRFWKAQRAGKRNSGEYITWLWWESSGWGLASASKNQTLEQTRFWTLPGNWDLWGLKSNIDIFSFVNKIDDALRQIKSGPEIIAVGGEQLFASIFRTFNW